METAWESQSSFSSAGSQVQGWSNTNLTPPSWRYQPQLVSEQKILSLAREKVGEGKGQKTLGQGRGHCSYADGVDRQRWFLGQLNVLSNDLLHDLVEMFSLAAAQLNCTGSDLKLHLFAGVVIF